MKSWILIFFGLLSLSCNSQTTYLSEMEFTRLYLDSLKRNYPEATFTIESELTIKADYKGQEYIYFFDNSYKEYQMDKASLDFVISKWVASLDDVFREKVKIQTDRIIPLIKPINFLDDIMRLAADKNASEPWIVYEKYNDRLIIVYAEDSEKSISYLSKEEFSKLNINSDTLRQLAVKNLTRILPGIQKYGGDETFGLAAGGDYEASLILLTSLWTNESYNVDGDFVIAIPNRDMLLVTGSNNRGEIERIRAISDDTYKRGDHPISPYLFIKTGEKFEEYK